MITAFARFTDLEKSWRIAQRVLLGFQAALRARFTPKLEVVFPDYFEQQSQLIHF